MLISIRSSASQWWACRSQTVRCHDQELTANKLTLEHAKIAAYGTVKMQQLHDFFVSSWNPAWSNPFTEQRMSIAIFKLPEVSHTVLATATLLSCFYFSDATHLHNPGTLRSTASRRYGSFSRDRAADMSHETSPADLQENGSCISLQGNVSQEVSKTYTASKTALTHDT